MSAESLLGADATTPRIVKKAEALFKLMPPTVAEFNHFGPAEWLMSNPTFLGGSDPEIDTTLDLAETIFKTYNGLLK